MPLFRKIPVVVEAVRFLGEQNMSECIAFAGRDSWNDGNGGITIQTLEGFMTASPGDWIVLGVEGEIYPVKPTIFLKTYEPVSE